MKIQFVSDLHLEFSENIAYLTQHPIQPVGDVLILAGDIVPFSRMEEHSDFFSFCSDHYLRTLWIPGNHEYYHGDLQNSTGSFSEEIVSGVFLVNNHVLLLENARIILSTLWTPISESRRAAIEEFLYDYKRIRDNGLPFTSRRSTQLYNENIQFIKDSAGVNEKDHCIVVTHHVPTFEHYPAEYRDSPLNEGFATELRPFIEKSGIDYWIYGHHHRNVEDFKIGNTQMMTNQLGYVKAEEHHRFRTDRFIEI